MSVEKGKPIYFCPVVNYKKPTPRDERFDTATSISLYEFESANGVYESLDKSIPRFMSGPAAEEINARSDILLKFMTRKRYKWDLEC